MAGGGNSDRCASRAGAETGPEVRRHAVRGGSGGSGGSKFIGGRLEMRMIWLDAGCRRLSRFEVRA